MVANRTEIAHSTAPAHAAQLIKSPKRVAIVTAQSRDDWSVGTSKILPKHNLYGPAFMRGNPAWFWYLYSAGYVSTDLIAQCTDRNVENIGGTSPVSAIADQCREDELTFDLANCMTYKLLKYFVYIRREPRLQRMCWQLL